MKAVQTAHADTSLFSQCHYLQSSLHVVLHPLLHLHPSASLLLLHRSPLSCVFSRVLQLVSYPLLVQRHNYHRTYLRDRLHLTPSAVDVQAAHTVSLQRAPVSRSTRHVRNASFPGHVLQMMIKAGRTSDITMGTMDGSTLMKGSDSSVLLPVYRQLSLRCSHRIPKCCRSCALNSATSP